MLGIIGAMDKETDMLFAKMTDVKETTIGYSRFAQGDLNGLACVIARCGIGKVHAAMCAQSMISLYHPDAVINIGVAGALEESLAIADIVIASSEVQHDIDTSPIGDPVGLISGPNIIHIPCDESLRDLLEDAARECGLPYLRRAIATGDQFICGEANKRRLAQQFGAGACDMEGGAIAQVCYEFGVPYAAFRSISDTLRGSGMEYAACAALAGQTSAKLLQQFLQLYRRNVL